MSQTTYANGTYSVKFVIDKIWREKTRTRYIAVLKPGL